MGLRIEALSAGYGEGAVIQDLSLNVAEGETVILMGPSGSGKTTLLLALLGILPLMSGTVFLNGSDITQLPIEERGIGYLPQDYGLFPHMNVLDNIGFGLRVRKVTRGEREERAREMLHLVHLSGFERRKIRELSGGERQRVGLARALAVRPKLLLLDEPLSNVDQVTKGDVANELKELFGRLNIPILFVTHNHEDALFLAETIAILIAGRIEQVGKAEEILEHPKSVFIQRLLKPFS